MAYIGHSPVREFRGFAGASLSDGYGAAFLKSALVAIAAAAAILALSESGGTATTASLAKSDRIAAPRAAVVATAGFSIDAGAGVTTVERGATVPLSPDSPFRSGR